MFGQAVSFSTHVTEMERALWGGQKRLFADFRAFAFGLGLGLGYSNAITEVSRAQELGPRMTR